MAKETILPPYNPYDPEQNQLLTVLPDMGKHPMIREDLVRSFVDGVDAVIGAGRDYLRIQRAKTLAEYCTSYNYACNNPITLCEPTVANSPRQDFNVTAVISPKTEVSTFDKESAPRMHP